MFMFSKVLGRSSETVKLPNHTLLYWLILTVLGALVGAGAVTRLYELREFFPLRLPDRVSEVILNYIPFILGTFITTVAALAGLIVGLNWIIGGLREMSCLRIPLRWPGDYYRPEGVSLSLKEGRVRTYDHSPSMIFFILGKFWSNAKYISEISGGQRPQKRTFSVEGSDTGCSDPLLVQDIGVASALPGSHGAGNRLC